MNELETIGGRDTRRMSPEFLGLMIIGSSSMTRSGTIIWRTFLSPLIGLFSHRKVSCLCIPANTDKLADWFEAYVKSMELNVWTSTNIVGKPKFDPKTHQWTVTLKRADGTERTLHPRHVILASGHSGEPRVPKLPGMETFQGDIHHSSQHSGGYKYKGKKAVVVGCCNSGHDI